MPTRSGKSGAKAARGKRTRFQSPSDCLVRRETTVGRRSNRGIFRRAPRKTQPQRPNAMKIIDLWRSSARSLGPVIAVNRSGAEQVFRAVVLSIVLALTAGPSAMLSCLAWCGHHYAGHVSAAEACHEGAAPSGVSAVAGDEACRGSFVDALAFIREDTARAGSRSPEHRALAISRSQLAWVAVSSYPPATSTARGAFERAPGIALRI